MKRCRRCYALLPEAAFVFRLCRDCALSRGHIADWKALLIARRRELTAGTDLAFGDNGLVVPLAAEFV